MNTPSRPPRQESWLKAIVSLLGEVGLEVLLAGIGVFVAVALLCAFAWIAKVWWLAAAMVGVLLAALVCAIVWFVKSRGRKG